MEKIINYLVSECGQKPNVATIIAMAFERHQDIRTELEGRIDNQKYPKTNPLVVEEYTAEMISELASFMNRIGVYNFMVTLREHPERGKSIISEGFPRK